MNLYFLKYGYFECKDNIQKSEDFKTENAKPGPDFISAYANIICREKLEYLSHSICFFVSICKDHSLEI